MHTDLLSNLFSVGSFIAFSFAILSSLFLISLKGASKSTRYLGYSLLGMAFLDAAYVISSSVYHPFAAYHRYLSVGGAIFGSTASIMFMMEYLVPVTRRKKQILFFSHLFYSAIVVGLFIAITLSTSVSFGYHFDGHFWDFSGNYGPFTMAEISSHIGKIIMANVGLIAVAAVLNYRRTKSKSTLLILAGILLVTVLPGYMNVASRDGKFSRELYMTFFVIFKVIGYFFIIIVYINNTKDKTTFMAKIVGISLVTILLLLQFIGQSSLTVKEDLYNQVKQRDTALLQSETETTNDAAYSALFHLEDHSFDITYHKNVPTIDFSGLKASFVISYMYQAISQLKPGPGFTSALKNLLQQAPSEFKFYSSIIEDLGAKPVKSGHALIGQVENYKRTILQIQKKIEKASKRKLKKTALVMLEKLPGEFKAARAHLKSILAKKSIHLVRESLLAQLTPFEPGEARHYRADTRENNHFIAFHRINLAQKTVYEGGFYYLDYRNFIHPLAFTFTVFLVIAIVVVVIGYRFFFAGALVNPLDNLLGAVARVNKGDLDIEIEIEVEDEIGFLSHSFNSMVASIRDARKKLQDYADELEDKVKERTRELQATLEEVQALKEKQDGDYFLTSLLIQPLSRNNVKSNTVNVDFFSKQYKTFKFRRWQSEIGGDLNAANSIKLKQKDYTVLFNADAMGKSMQGAGGALVLGAVFQSIIERTKVSKAANDLFPERWLKNTFLELHKAFEAFDGSMLVSLVLALIDDETGLMYFINAEHPFTILYRDKQASFIESELFYRKLGTTGLQGGIHIRTFQLQPGDRVIMGSDGRDDLATHTDEKGNRVINEDESLVLKLIEQADADLEKVYELASNFGEITDDFTLVKAGYREQDLGISKKVTGEHSLTTRLAEAKEYRLSENYEKAIEILENIIQEYKSDRTAYREIVRIYLKKKDYMRATQYAEDYMVLRPGEAEMIYIASYCNKLLHKYDYAADLGERVRLRNPDMIKNLLNLADIYSILGVFKRAEGLLDEVNRLDPLNEQAARLSDYIESKKSNP